MQNLLSDFHPDFTASEQGFIDEFNIEANGYDLRHGPCCGRKWFEAHDALPFVQIDEVAEGMLHPDLITIPEDGEHFDEPVDGAGSDGSHRLVDYVEIREWLCERYPAYMESPKRADNSVDEFRDFSQFPGTLGSHKAIEVTVKKWCVTRRFTRLCESHGKRGRK